MVRYQACHQCDAVHELRAVPLGMVARCQRCDAVLHRPKGDSVNSTLALVLAGAILFLIANFYPFLEFKIGAQVRETTLATGIYQLYRQDMAALATVVLFTVVVVPGMHLAGMLYILVPLQWGRQPRHLARVFGLIKLLKPWSMMEIFMLGILVSVFKLVKMATIIPGQALYAFFALIFVLAAMVLTLDEDMIWQQVEVSS